MNRNLAWTIVASGATLALVWAGERVLESGWRLTTGETPPEDPDADDVDWARALAWAAASAAVYAAARLAPRRGAAEGWERVTGSPPPD